MTQQERKQNIKDLMAVANVISENKNYLTTVTAAQLFLDKQDILEATLTPQDKQKLKQDLKSFIQLGSSIILTLEKVETKIVEFESNVTREGLYQQMVDQTEVMNSIMIECSHIPDIHMTSLQNDIRALFDKYKKDYC